MVANFVSFEKICALTYFHKNTARCISTAKRLCVVRPTRFERATCGLGNLLPVFMHFMFFKDWP